MLEKEESGEKGIVRYRKSESKMHDTEFSQTVPARPSYESYLEAGYNFGR